MNNNSLSPEAITSQRPLLAPYFDHSLRTMPLFLIWPLENSRAQAELAGPQPPDGHSQHPTTVPSTGTHQKLTNYPPVLAPQPLSLGQRFWALSTER